MLSFTKYTLLYGLGILLLVLNTAPQAQDGQKSYQDTFGEPSVAVESLGHSTTYYADSLPRRYAFTYSDEGCSLQATDSGSTRYIYDSTPEIHRISYDPSDRMIVQRANLSLVVSDAPTSLDHLQQVITDQQGVIINLETSQTAQGGSQTNVSLQVPAESLADTLSQIKALGTDVLFEHITSQDVTASYADLDARLRNLESTETELQALLQTAQDRGDTAEGILQIYNRLSDTRGQIEQLQAQKNSMEKSVALAQIDVSLIPEQIAPGFRPLQVLGNAWTQFLQVLQWAATGLIWMIVFAPLILILIGIVVVIQKARYKVRNRTFDKKSE